MALTSSVALDLSKLPPPAFVETLDYEAILSALIAAAREEWPDFTPRESDPATKILQVFAYREMLLRQRLNDVGRSIMLAFGRDSDLDHLAAFYGVERQLIRAATDSEPAIWEDDDSLRARIQLAPEQLPYAGLTGAGYRSRVRRLTPAIKDVASIKRDGGQIDIVLLARDGDGTVSPDIVHLVTQSFQDDDAVQLTDIVTVRAADILPYDVALTLWVRPGPDQSLLRAAAQQAVRGYAALRHRVGAVVFAQMISSAASVGGVEHVTIAGGDIDPGPYGAPWLRDLSIAIETVGA
ncbi:phage-related baseplate assembly protein [Sphingobium wenxiniae]|nr:baseplate J/gp47 family protein [Sphingobium wenxiniae]MBB6191511.1 phage-related baseplate assembly protein [Sphingobium wenxiniae]